MNQPKMAKITLETNELEISFKAKDIASFDNAKLNEIAKTFTMAGNMLPLLSMLTSKQPSLSDLFGVVSKTKSPNSDLETETKDDECVSPKENHQYPRKKNPIPPQMMTRMKQNNSEERQTHMKFVSCSKCPDIKFSTMKDLKNHLFEHAEKEDQKTKEIAKAKANRIRQESLKSELAEVQNKSE